MEQSPLLNFKDELSQDLSNEIRWRRWWERARDGEKKRQIHVHIEGVDYIIYVQCHVKLWTLATNVKPRQANNEWKKAKINEANTKSTQFLTFWFFWLFDWNKTVSITRRRISSFFLSLSVHVSYVVYICTPTDTKARFIFICQWFLHDIQSVTQFICSSYLIAKL